MGVSLKCPECRAKLKVPDKVAGRSVTCPLCSAELAIDETNHVYRLALDDSPPARPNAAPDERPSMPTVVKVIVKNSPAAKGESTWIAKHVVEVVLGMVGTIATAALLAYFGLSLGDNKGEAKRDKTEPPTATAQPAEIKAPHPAVKPQTVSVVQEPSNLRVTSDRRVRWFCATYNTTISCVGGKVWIEIDNATGKQKWQLIEQTRTAKYIELKGGTAGTMRIHDKRMDYLKDGHWEWLSNGSWANTSPVTSDR